MAFRRNLLSLSLFFLAVAAVAFGPQSSLISQAADPEPKLEIILPPSDILTPTELHIAGKIFAFSGDSFAPNNYNALTVTTTKGTIADLNNYIITISGFTKGSGGGTAKNLTTQRLASGLSRYFSAQAYSPPPAGILPCLFLKSKCPGPEPTPPPDPYEFKLLFKERKKQDANALAAKLKLKPYHEQSYVGDANCQPDVTQDHLCIRTIISMPDFANDSKQRLLQAIPISNPGTITVEGNVAGSGTITGFSFDDKSKSAIAVGGTVRDVSGGADNVPDDYINKATALQWGTISSQITSLVDANKSKATEFIPATLAGNPNLNATGATFTGSPSSFSSPPEGKLWKTRGDLTINGANISGSGTIIVNGNLTIKNSLSCETGTRLGIIASGTITIDTGTIGCGASVARGGNMHFATNLTNTTTTYTANGIFVSSANILLPTLADEVSFKIKYDSVFASNPTILFKELLSIIFTTTS